MLHRRRFRCPSATVTLKPPSDLHPRPGRQLTELRRGGSRVPDRSCRRRRCLDAAGHGEHVGRRRLVEGAFGELRVFLLVVHGDSYACRPNRRYRRFKVIRDVISRDEGCQPDRVGVRAGCQPSKRVPKGTSGGSAAGHGLAVHPIPLSRHPAFPRYRSGA